MRPLPEPAPDPTPTTRAPARTASAVAPTLRLCLLLCLALGLGGGAALADGRGAGAPVPATTTGWVRPVPGDVRGRFDPPASAWSAGHRGVDLTAAAGQPVRSPAPGTVTFAGSVAGKPVVVVAHPGGLRSTFEPAVATVERGAAVSAGDVVARRSARDAGSAHCAARGCVHWGVLRGETYLDPLTLLGEDVPIVLLPPAVGR